MLLFAFAICFKASLSWPVKCAVSAFLPLIYYMASKSKSLSNTGVPSSRYESGM